MPGIRDRGDVSKEGEGSSVDGQGKGKWSHAENSPLNLEKRGGGKQERVKGDKVMKEDLIWDGEHTIQCTGDVL